MWTLYEDCTTSKAAIYDRPVGETKKAAILEAFDIWTRLSDYDQRHTDAFYIQSDDGEVIDIMRGPYRYELHYWVSCQGYSHSETWDCLDYYLPARVFLDTTFVDRDDAVGLRNDAVNVEVYLDDELVDEFWHVKEESDEQETD